MSRKKKLTRKEKIELSKKRICWKCNGKLEKKNGSFECQSCGFVVNIL